MRRRETQTPQAEHDQMHDYVVHELPALAMLDMGLPDLNGFDQSRRLQAVPE